MVASVSRQTSDPEVLFAQLCQVAAQALAVDAVGMRFAIGGVPDGLIATNGVLATKLEELQTVLGEGPSRQAARSAVDGFHPNLALGRAAAWPVFRAESEGLGVRAIFVFPLNVGAISVGIVTLYRCSPGELDRQQLGAAHTFCDCLIAIMLDTQDDARSPAGGTGQGIWPAVTYSPEFHQATGMVSDGLQISLADAATRLRAHSYANDKSLRTVSEDIVSRRLLSADLNEQPRP